MALKHDIVLLGYLPSGLGYYRFSYNGSDKAYVGVIALTRGITELFLAFKLHRLKKELATA